MYLINNTYISSKNLTSFFLEGGGAKKRMLTKERTPLTFDILSYEFNQIVLNIQGVHYLVSRYRK